MTHTDIALDTNMDIFIDQSNDIAQISGHRQLEQSVALSVRNVTVNFVGRELTGTQLGYLEEQIKEALNSNPHISTVGAVVVEQYDRPSNTIKVTAKVAEDEDLELEVGI